MCSQKHNHTEQIGSSDDTSHLHLGVRGSNHIRRTNYPEWSFLRFTQPHQANSKLLSSIRPARLPSQVNIHCRLFIRRHTTTAAERALNVKINKAGKGREVLSSNHCGRGKSISIKYSECLSVFLPKLFGMKSACAYYDSCYLYGTTTCFHITLHTAPFSEYISWEKNV